MLNRPNSGAHAAGWGRGAILVLLTLLTIVAAWYLTTDPPELVHAEGGPVERLQLAFWVTALLLLAVRAFRGPTRMDAVGGAWLLLIATLATMRELDLHHLPRPEHLGEWGMRFQTRWWLKPENPLGPKLLWGGIGIVMLCALGLPVWHYGRRALRLVQARDVTAVLVAVAIMLCMASFTADDLLRGQQFLSRVVLQGLEEVFELLAAAAYAGAGLAVVLRPPSERIRACESGQPRPPLTPLAMQASS